MKPVRKRLGKYEFKRITGYKNKVRTNIEMPVLYKKFTNRRI